MARMTGPDCKLCRREGIKLFLKGAKCDGPKCTIERRPSPPGVHGMRRARGKESPYKLRLREKQKARRFYGIMEKQFRGYYDLAARQKGSTGENLMRLLERRLDNTVFRAGFAQSRDDARQLVLHRHLLVNGKIVATPSFLVRVGDVVAIKEASHRLDRIEGSTERAELRSIPTWLQSDLSTRQANVVSLPQRTDIDAPVRETLIVEFYSR